MKSKAVKATKVHPIANIFKSDLSLMDKYKLLFRRIKNKLGNVPVYFMLLALAFVFLLPFIYMITKSFMTATDLANPNVKWLPRSFNFKNYDMAIRGLKYVSKAWISIYTTGLCVIGQLLTCTFVAYGIARIKFKGNGLIFALVLFSLLIPPQTIITPQFYMYSQVGWLNTYLPIIVPCFFANGLNGGLFIFIFRQFFKSMPTELENAALIDGCGIFKAYFRIILPNCGSSMLVCLILSMVWQWNNSFEPAMFIKNATEKGNLPIQLSLLSSGQQGAIASGVNLNLGVEMAAAFLTILPILIVFFFLQNKFMKGIERIGLAN